jgi:hypothetical protein
MGAVGCGSHSALIVDRGGAVVAGADVLVEVDWTRVLNDTSTARIVVHPDGDCCARLGRVRSWRHKLLVFRDGRPVWEGPVLQPRWTAEGVEIAGADILAWLDRRVPHASIRFTATELTVIARWLIDDGFAPDDPGHSVQVASEAMIAGDREYTVDVGQVGDHLRDLAATGIDFTAVGSRIVLMGDQYDVPVGSLSDEDFPAGLRVVEDGVSLATRWVVHGDGDVKGVAGGVHPYYGLLERSVDENSVLDGPSAAAAARSRLAGSQPAPVWVDSDQATLAPDAPVDVPSLVPGWCLDVTTTRTCRPVAQRLKIMSVRVVENGDGETVAVRLAPVGMEA